MKETVIIHYLDGIENFNKNKNKFLLNLVSSFKPNDLCVKCANSPLNGGKCIRRENNIEICEQ
jgi:hypothetical protein